MNKNYSKNTPDTNQIIATYRQAVTQRKVFEEMSELFSSDKFKDDIVRQGDPVKQILIDFKTYLNSKRQKAQHGTLNHQHNSIKLIESRIQDIKRRSKGGIVVLSADQSVLKSVKLGDIDAQKCVLPFECFFVDMALAYTDQNSGDIYVTRGVLVTRGPLVAGNRSLLFDFIWSSSFAERIGFSQFICRDYASLGNRFETVSGSDPMDFQIEFQKKIQETTLKLIHLIQTRSYSTYGFHSAEGFTKKEIVYETQVKSHKRHFYRNSGHFRIPHLPKQEILARGYGIDEIVVRDTGEICENVPFTIIGSFKKNEGKETANRRVEFVKRKNLKQEKKLGDLLCEIFPGEHIRHDKQISKNSKYRFDYYIPRLKIAFEYDGEQHFDKELYELLYGDGFEEQRIRDRQKNALCRQRKVQLIRVKYDEPLTIANIRKKIKSSL